MTAKHHLKVLLVYSLHQCGDRTAQAKGPELEHKRNERQEKMKLDLLSACPLSTQFLILQTIYFFVVGYTSIL